jgi:hypothetical protein
LRRSAKRKRKDAPPAGVRKKSRLGVEHLDLWHEKTYGHSNQPSWQWPPNYPPNLSPKAADRIKWVIDEAERVFKEASEALPELDPAGHDRQLEYLLLDFASVIYCAFLDEAKEQLRSGGWSVGKHGDQDFSIIAGRFLRDIGKGICQKFKALAVSAENKIEWKAQVFANSEVVYAVVNSIRVRQENPELTSSVKAYLFESLTDRRRSRGGRPRKDMERVLIRTKKDAGKSWNEITNEVNQETGQQKTADAYRSLLRSHSGDPKPPGRNGQN